MTDLILTQLEPLTSNELNNIITSDGQLLQRLLDITEGFIIRNCPILSFLLDGNDEWTVADMSQKPVNSVLMAKNDELRKLSNHFQSSRAAAKLLFSLVAEKRLSARTSDAMLFAEQRPFLC